MTSQLEQLKKMTTVVADTGDIDAIIKWQPQDATTNPSLLLKAASLDMYASLLEKSIHYGKSKACEENKQIADASDFLAVAIGCEILKHIPGRVSTEVDARLSFDTQATIDKAKRIIDLYAENGISKDRVLIKIASTWEGIKAADQLEKLGIRCNLTLLFGLAQAHAAADAGAYLISPFVGRILDWHKENSGRTEYAAEEDPGVISVSKIYNFYKQSDYKTVVMGASFRSVGEIEQLAGCDRLTISPEFLEQLASNENHLSRKLSPSQQKMLSVQDISETDFRDQLSEDKMANDKLTEGIQKFVADQIALEKLLKEIAS